jgi:hypothetical protein
MNNRMHGRQLVSSLAALAALTAASGVPALAAPVTRVYIVAVSAPKDHAFREAVMAWDACQRANGSRSTVRVYDADTGDVGRYAFLQTHASWADMDHKNPAGKACAALFRTGVMPNITAASSHLTQISAKVTYMPGGDPGPAPMLWVNAYRIKPGQGHSFHAALEKLAAAAAKKHWEGHFAGYDVMGSGEGGEDFLMVWPNKNWADAGTEAKPSMKDMMYSVYGKSAAKANRRRFEDSIAEDWSDVWSYDKELSVTPEK